MTINSNDILNETLKLAFIECPIELNPELQEELLNFIILGPIEVEMSGNSKSRLLEKLRMVATTLSLGQLLRQELGILKMSSEDITTSYKLPQHVVNDLLSDNIYANNIPIIILKDILAHLRISFKRAEESIWRTYEILQNKISEDKFNKTILPSFRKGYRDIDQAALVSNSINNRKELFENKESLNKYLNRLSELLSN